MFRIYSKPDWFDARIKGEGAVAMEKYSGELIKRAEKVKVLVLDVDGVLTDGRITYGSSGEEFKSFNVNDGLGIILVRRAGMRCAILTAKGSRVVRKRAKELKIDKVYQDFHYKIKALEPICCYFGVQEEELCFVGDDVIDIPVLKRVGLAVCPADAVEKVKDTVHLVTEKSGGNGAVREICDLLIKARGKWDEVLGVYFENGSSGRGHEVA